MRAPSSRAFAIVQTPFSNWPRPRRSSSISVARSAPSAS
jgi:hypothetical protein